MRSGKLFFVLSLILVASLAIFLFGCGDDKPTASAPTDQDLNYAAVSDEAEEVLDSAISSFANALSVYDLNQPIDTAIIVVYSPINPDSVSEEDNWFVVYASDLATSFNWNRVDSLQFALNGIPLASGAGANQLSLRHHFELAYEDTTGIYRNREGNAELEFTGINTLISTVNGTRDVAISSRAEVNGVEWRRDYTINMAFEGVTVPKADGNWVRGCPSGGVVTGTVVLTASKNDVSLGESTWDFEATFDNGTVDVTVTSGSYTRTYTTSLCDM
ncbi:MAG: hypothetical protein IPH75_15095 [bacterium]|nr:hypothetical protein [bacterium]